MNLEINGKKIGIKFNNWAIEQYPKLIDTEKSQWGFFYAIVFCGYEGWKFVKENQPGFIDPQLTFEEIVDWVDKSTTEETINGQVQEVFRIYTESQAYLKMIKDAEKKSIMEADQPLMNSPEQSQISTNSPLESLASGPAIITG